jgi:MoxR-like ATPase
VFATQNPIEQEGTYPLPEAQLDRFMFSSTSATRAGRGAGDRAAHHHRPDQPVTPVLDPERILALQSMVRRMPHNDIAVQYAVDLVRATRPDDPSAPPFIKEYVSGAPARARASTSSSPARPARCSPGARPTAAKTSARSPARCSCIAC